MTGNINAEPDYGDEPPFACSSIAVHDGEAFACGGTPGHAGKHRYLIEWDGRGDLAQGARPAPEIRTCYCGTTATVVPGVFPHPDCDGSAGARPAPGLRAALEATLADWRDDAVYRPTDTRDEITEHYAVTTCADTLAGVLADYPETGPEPAPELAAAMRETRELRELAADILAAFGPSGSGHTARVGQVQIRKWRTRAGLPS